MVQGVGDHLSVDPTRRIIFELLERMVFVLVNSADGLRFGTIEVNLIRGTNFFELQNRRCSPSNNSAWIEYLKAVREFTKAYRSLIYW